MSLLAPMYLHRISVFVTATNVILYQLGCVNRFNTAKWCCHLNMFFQMVNSKLLVKFLKEMNKSLTKLRFLICMTITF